MNKETTNREERNINKPVDANNPPKVMETFLVNMDPIKKKK